MVRKPVIFIPGFPSSELHSAISGEILFPPPLSKMLNSAKKAALLAELEIVPGDVKAGPPIASILGGVVPESQTIYNILRGQYGYDISFNSRELIPIGWDWRQSIGCDDTVQRIVDALNILSPEKNGNVVAILHSVGGLVLRAFLEKRPELAACFDQLLTFGVPWGGTLQALHAAAIGESAGFLFINLLTAAEGQGLMSRAQAAYELMPTDPGFNIFLDQNGNPTTPLIDQTWMTQQYM